MPNGTEVRSLPKGARLEGAPTLPPGATLVSEDFNQPTQWEKDRSGGSGTGWWEHTKSALSRMLPQPPQSLGEAFTGAAKLTPLALPFTTAAKGAESAGAAGQAYYSARARGHGIPYSVAVGVNAPLGVNAEAMEKAADIGDTGGVLGEATPSATMAVAPLAAEGVIRAAPVLRSGAARFAPAAGAAGGYAAGGWPGLILGREAGQGLRSILTPKEAPLAVSAPPDPFGGMTSSRVPGGTATLPEVPKGAPTPFPSVQPKSPLGVSPQPEPQWFPEPRAETPIDRPGSMWSVERETLPTRAGRGQPGALDVLTNIGDRPPLVTPKPSIGAPNPEFNELRGRSGLFDLGGYQNAGQGDIASPTPVSAAGTDMPQGSPTPFEGPPSNLAKVWSDKLRDPTLSEYERNTLLDQWKGTMGYDWRPR